MVWKVIYDPDYRNWLESQESGLQNELSITINLLKVHGPYLSRPYVDTIKNNRIGNLKELRIQYKGDPWRILFAFDPARQAIVLVGGCKRGDKRWYEKNIPIAVMRYERHLKNLE